MKAGEAAALPTETVYGLGASLSAKAGLKKIFHIKKRPFSDPLIVHCRNITEALGLTSAADVSLIRLLWKNFSPGPLTLVLPKSRKVPDIVTGGQSTVALRIPSHPLIRSVLKALGQPIAAPSANMFGRASPTRAEHVLQGLKGQAPVLDGGPCSHGLESSIVQLDFLQKRLIILRPGAVSKERLNSFSQREENTLDSVPAARAAARLSPLFQKNIIKAQKLFKKHGPQRAAWINTRLFRHRIPEDFNSITRRKILYILCRAKGHGERSKLFSLKNCLCLRTAFNGFRSLPAGAPPPQAFTIIFMFYL